MNTCYCCTTNHTTSRISLILGVFLFLMLGAVSVRAQELITIGNPYVTTAVVASNASNIGGGRFVIDAGPFHGSHRFLFFITSNVVFKVTSYGRDFYYTNAKDQFGGQPTIDGFTPIPYHPFDSIRSNSDTIEVYYSGMNGYSVIMRLIPEKPTTSYDRGTDVLIEFSYKFDPIAPPAELGIFMMLDTYNGQANGSGGAGDKSSILTSRGYFPADGPGKLFEPPFEPVPDFYHVGNFLATPPPINNVLPVHRLRGFSHGGRPLTTPELLAVGSWRVLRNLGWDVTASDVGGSNVGDCATAVRWSGLRGTGTIRTAFGMDDKEGNNLFHCRDNNIFVDIKTERLVEQKVKDGAYTPAQFDVTMWLTNTSTATQTVTITFDQPIGAPSLTGRLTLDPSTPAVQVVPMAMRETKEIRWKLNLAPGTNDSLIDIPLNFRYQFSGSGTQPRVFRDPCKPIVTIKGYREVPPPRDTIAPVIDRGAVMRVPKPAWGFRTYDRHPGYRHDTGLDKVVVEQNDLNNFNLFVNPSAFTRCDTMVNLDLLAQVVDSTQPARIVFAVYDCRGNISRDSAIYNPRPDIFPPQIRRADSTGSWGPPCNARLFEFYLIDSLNQTPTAGDNGFGLISVLGPLDNFDPIEVNFDRSNTPIRDFDRRASFRLRVTDSMFDAHARIWVVDYAGNADTIEVDYCTLPDTKAPEGSVSAWPNPSPNEGPKGWTVFASDTQAWDRGLESIVALSNTNMNFTPPAIKPGIDSVSFPVSVILDSMDAEIVLEIRDRYYAATPEGHADTITLSFRKIPDTLAPNITYVPQPGTNGSKVDVTVDDIHYFGNSRYQYDRGLWKINVTALSSNLRLVTLPSNFSVGDSTMSFSFEVVDTLALIKRDSICLEAYDIYGNRSEACYYYPLPPDAKSPIITGALDPSRTSITARATDSRQYDRGLGSVIIENPKNLDVTMATSTGLNGTPETTVIATVIDPTEEIGGTFVVRDLIAELEPTLETEATHAVRIPFYLPAVKLSLEFPMMVEPSEDMKGAIVVADTFPGAAVQSIRFVANYTGDGLYKGVENGAATLSAVPNAGSLDITCSPDMATIYYPGDTLGLIVFTAGGSNAIEEFSITVDQGSLEVNGNVGSEIRVQKAGDTAISRLQLPAPFFRMVADSLTFINGVCERILTTIAGRNKINGLSILAIRPQPATIAAGGKLEIDVRELSGDGATGDLVAVDGRKVASFTVGGTSARVTRVSVELPQDLPPGAYFLQLRTATDRAWAKVVVVE